MNQNVKKRWVDALRSGKYVQDHEHSVLHTKDDRYCCLGVLCAIAHDEYVVERTFKKGSWFYGPDSNAYPPPSVVRWAELDQPNPKVILRGTPISLAALNDQGHTFDEIADLIEEQL